MWDAYKILLIWPFKVLSDTKMDSLIWGTNWECFFNFLHKKGIAVTFKYFMDYFVFHNIVFYRVFTMERSKQILLL